MKTLSLLAVALLGIALPRTSAAQPAPSKEFLPPLPVGKEWKLVWNDEFDGTKLDETKWNRLGDRVRKGGWWLKEDAHLSGQGTLLLRTKKDGDRFTCGAANTKGKFEQVTGRPAEVNLWMTSRSSRSWSQDLRQKLILGFPVALWPIVDMCHF